MGPRLIESIWFGCDPVFARVFERFSPIITIRHCRTSSIGASSPSSPRVMPMSSSPGSVPQIGESCAKTYKEWRPCFSITGNRFSATLSTPPRSPFATESPLDLKIALETSSKGSKPTSLGDQNRFNKDDSKSQIANQTEGNAIGTKIARTSVERRRARIRALKA